MGVRVELRGREEELARRGERPVGECRDDELPAPKVHRGEIPG
jgi:hypothetical protein